MALLNMSEMPHLTYKFQQNQPGIFIFLCRGRAVLGYTEMELCMKGTGYQFIHAADMMYCADSHIHSMSALVP